MVGIDSLNSVFRAGLICDPAVGIHLDQLYAAVSCKTAVCSFIVRTKCRLRGNDPCKCCGDALGAHLTQLRRLREGKTAVIYRAGDADLLGGQTGGMDRAASLMGLSGQDKVPVIALIGYIEKGLIRLHNTVQIHLVRHRMEGVQDFMPPQKSCRHRDPALVGGLPESLFLKHAFEIGGPDRKPFSRSGGDRPGCRKKRLFAVAAQKTLSTVFSCAVPDNMIAAAVDTAVILCDPCFNQERLQVVIVQTDVIRNRGIESGTVAE